MRNIILVLLTLLVLSFSFSIFAEEDLPDSIMNWCADDGPFAGQCTVPGDEALTNYMWELGWYLAAVDRGEISAADLPDRFIKKDAAYDEETGSDSSDPTYNCKPITLPSLPDNVATVSGELVYGGATYGDFSVSSTTYEFLAEGKEFDPSIIGGKYKVKVHGTDSGGEVVKNKTYRFSCDGDFDTSAIIIP